jgi:N-acetyl-gamma-glutamyl-phosphate reductase
VNSLTGITGAGRTATEVNMFTSIDSNARAYGLLNHRHTPEIEQEIGAQVLFTPHHVPMNRGILATCTAPATDAASADAVMAALTDFYVNEPFVSARYDARTGTVIAMCAIDNLTKGASGGAVQSANVALGIDEAAGLTTVGVAP